MDFPVVIILFYLFAAIFAAPTYHAQSRSRVSTTDAFYSELMEDVCSDLTLKACVDHDGYAFRYSIFDPVSGFCICSTSPSEYMVNKKCRLTTCPPDRDVAYYWPTNDSCFCETEDFFTLAWNYLLQDSHRTEMRVAKSILEVERNDLISQHAIEATAAIQTGTSSANAGGPISMLRQTMAETTETSPSAGNGVKVHKRQDNPTASPTQAAPDTVVPTFVPPPDQDLTPELLNQSLSTQPQKVAKVASVIAHLADEVITILVQLDGIVANLIPMNTSTTFPCGSIGSNPQPNIMLVPKHVQGGAQQTIVANCRCIAVNQLKPDLINWWVLNKLDGSLFSLAGKAEVTDIDKIDTGAPIALSMIASSVSPSKRELVAVTRIVELPRRQVFRADVCDRRCPTGMEPIPGNLLKNPPECGCLARETSELKSLAARGLSAPGPYTAIMDEAACKSMKCTNNDDKPPMWNPFDMQCWCAEPTYYEVNDSAWTPGGSGKD